MAVNDVYMLPPSIRAISQMAELLSAEQAELELLYELVEYVQNELIINDSTKLLGRYEQIFGISSNTELSTKERRNVIIAKINSKTSNTKADIESIASIITGHPAKIVEDFNTYTFTIAVKLLFSENTKVFHELRKQVNTLKPAHLLYDIDVNIEPIGLHNNMFVRLDDILMGYKVNNYGIERIFLNGRKNLDGTWMLRQIYSKGMNIFSLTLNLNQQNRLSVSGAITADTMYRLDGMYLVNGSKKLNAEIKRSEL